MKNIFKLFVPVAAAAIALVSCQPKEEQIGNNHAGEVTIRVHASADNLKAGDQETKTYIDNTNTILWGTGEYMKLALTAGENTQFVNSTDASADTFNGDAEAMFEFSVTPDSASEYVYQGLYPASAAVASSNTNAANYKVNLPAIQNATASSYDPAAYIMVAKPETFTSVQTDWLASYRRGTALNKITLKNVPSGVSINKVKITAEGKKLAGGRHFNLTTGEGLEVYATDAATIEVLYATALTGTNVDVWFTSWDTEIAEGEKLTIVAYTTDSKSYTKEIIVPAGKTIKFQEGYLNTLGASLSDITAEDVAILADGDYVILAKKGNEDVYYALKAEVSTTRIASVDYTGSTTSYVGNSDIIWSISRSGNSYIIANSGKYLGSDTVKAASWLAPDVDWTEEDYLLDITAQATDGLYYIQSHNQPTWYLSRNTSNAYFAFYANTNQYANIIFVPATALAQVETPTFSPTAGAVTSGSEVTISCATSGATIHYTVDGTDPTPSSSTYSSPIEITATTTIKAIAVKEGMADSEVASATYTVQGAGSDWELVSDFSTIEDGGEYIFVNVQNSTSYYMNTATCNQGGGTGCVALTILPTESGFVASDNMILVLSGSASGFVASNKEGKQLKIGAANNGLAINADSGTSLTFYTDEYVSGYTLTGNDTSNATRYIGMNSTTNFRCYTSVNNNVKTGEYVWYHHIVSGSNVTWNIESITITTPPTKTEYTAGESFDPTGMVVTGHFVDADDLTNTKDEAVTGYTISPDGALATTDEYVTITYQGKTANQTITVTSSATPTNTSTEANPYSAAEADALCGQLASNGTLADVYVSGIISAITTAYNSQYGNVSFNISADGLTTSTQFLIFRATASSADDYKVGDAVEFKGTIKNYNGSTHEMDAAATLIYQVHAPVISPNGGSFTDNQSVTITADSGATIRYTDDGTTIPTASAGSTYISALTLTESTTIKAIAIKDGHSTGVVTANFTKNNGGGSTPSAIVLSATTSGMPTSYGSKKAFDDATLEGYAFKIQQIYATNGGILQWRASGNSNGTGTMYNADAMPAGITSIVIVYNSSDNNKNHTVQIGSSANPTSATSITPSINGATYTFSGDGTSTYFVITNGSGAGYIDSITINFD